MQRLFQRRENSEDYIENVKQFCRGKKDRDYQEILKLDIDIDTIIIYLKKLIGKENISWLENDQEKGRLSLNTLIYLYQNNLE